MKIRELVEGGWSDVSTQSTRITPAIVRDMIPIIQNFIDRLNSWLGNRDILPIRFGNPVGSSFYWQRDLQNNPTKEYGDLDVTVYVEEIDGENDNVTLKKYTTAIQEFCNNSQRLQTSNGVNIVFNIGELYIQVDLVFTFEADRSWAPALLPEHGVKGAVSSSLYSSIAEALNISIGTRGVRGKMRDGELVPFKYRKDAEIVTISSNPDTWAKDVFEFLAKLHGKKYSAPIGVHGTDIREIRVSQLVEAIKWLAKALGAANLGTSREILSCTAEIFSRKMDEQISNPKFSKAQTAQAIKKRDQAIETFTKFKSTVVAALLS